MDKRKRVERSGFTLIEIVVTGAAAFIVTLGVAVVLVDGQRGYSSMFDRVYGDVVTDSYIARRTFDSVIRKASREMFLSDDEGKWIEVYYYADSDSTVVDRYARFYEADGEVIVEYGKLNPRETLTTQTLCENVSNCVFTRAGRSAQMILTLDNERLAITTVSAAVLHNR